MKINPINNVLFGKLYINKTDKNKSNIRLFANNNYNLAHLHDACSKIDSITEDAPVTLNLFSAQIPAGGEKTKTGWHFVVSDRKTGETLSEVIVEKARGGASQRKALEKLVNDLQADKFNWSINHTADDLIDKFN